MLTVVRRSGCGAKEIYHISASFAARSQLQQFSNPILDLVIFPILEFEIAFCIPNIQGVATFQIAAWLQTLFLLRRLSSREDL